MSQGTPERPARGLARGTALATPAKLRVVVLCGLAAFAPVTALPAQTEAGMLHTKHNLAVTGPGPVRATGETRICIFCHTPHNAAPASPLWNRELEPQDYTVYASSTLQAGVLPQPFGPTKLCLSCHDGTIAMGAVINPAGGIVMKSGGNLPPGSLSDFGLDLSGHHPVSFSYSAALPNPELEPLPPDDLTFGGADELHCTTCHDPHEEGYGEFLVKDNRYSALCITCHKMTDWPGSAHATSTASVVGQLPRPPKDWPTWTQLDEWGCEACHTPHFAPTAEELLNFTENPPAPFSCLNCHSSDPPGPPHPAAAPALVGGSTGSSRAGSVRADIGRQVNKSSAHHEASGQPRGLAAGFGRSGITGVGCIDCHNPHVTNTRETEMPYVSGLVAGVPGVDRNGAELQTATYEYEICLRCHADYAADAEFIPRVVASTNNRLDFDPANPSFHPVIEMGRAPDVPSIPSALAPRLSTNDRIACTSCHADDEGGARGPHGSSFPPILKERYETVDGTSESYDNYALCYRCHERTSILANQSFRTSLRRTTPSGGGHSGHLAAGATCSVCHDPHGVNTSGSVAFQATGDHTRLINFDTRIVSPVEGAPFPVFKDTGSDSGTCTLVCHGVTHAATAYP